MIVCRKTGEKMSAWKWMARICSKTPWMKTWSLRVYYWWKKLQYQKGYVEKEEINPKKVIFEAYMGKKYACSPKALYQAMCRDPQYQDWELIWAFREPEKYREMEQEPHTKVVRYRSGEYYRAYASAKFWVTNSRLPRELQPKEGQEYIQCWHGTPLKRLGYDLDHYAEKNGSLLEVQENYLEETKRVTHMPSPSEFYSEKIASAFHLKEEGKEQVLLEMGYPRNDDLVKFSNMDCEKARQELRIPKGKKVILYAPTWRENQHLPGEGYQFQLPVDFKRWREVLGEEYVVLFRAHYFISNSFDFEAFQGFVYDVSQMDDINPLYLAADVLITDYSSVFFDYANLRRPILFFMYDYEQYKHEMRDFYLDIHMLPGPVLMNQEEVLKTLKNLPNMVDKYEKKYAEFNNVFNPHRERCSEKYLREWMR